MKLQMNPDNEAQSVKCKVQNCGMMLKEEIFLSLAEFRRLRAQQELNPEITGRLSVQASSAFLSYYLTTGEYLREAITLLCEIATLEAEDIAKPGLKGIFPLLIERLSDSFNPEYCPLYDRAFAQVVAFCRHLLTGKPLDTQLRRFDLMDEQCLLARKTLLKDQRGKLHHSLKRSIKKVFVLSRVTVGAEVAITSIILAKLKQIFPQAELVLLADPRMRQLFGGDSRVRVRETPYERSGGLIDRLNSWLEVVETIDDEIRGLESSEFLVVDPDSRLTQLGILPVVEDDSRYLFFESRGYRKSGIGSIGQLTVNWLNNRFGGEDELYPYVSLPARDNAFGRQLSQKLRSGSSPYLVSISFGVGGNLRKRVPDPFEEKLILSLIDDGCVVLLDKGVGEEERLRANQLIAALCEKGKLVTEVDEASAPYILQSETISCHIATWEGGIGAFASLIAESDEYIGYDSAGQHIAAALAVPTIDIFADRSYPLFSERWRPYGKGPVKVVKLNDTKDAPDKVLTAVLACHQEFRKARMYK